ncbi:MAG TPA: T9SS type A sorting domain-containing protein [Flavipsychrobacter sp.]|nr:T9SS type A sorting domain-containing protein [Flavipsychrobacter sp.]
MKNLPLLFFALFITQWAFAQNAFPVSDSASWYHEMNYGSFHSYVTGDTVIQNRNAKRVRQEALVKEPEFSYGLRVHDLESLYLYGTADTVFVYNATFNRFTPLYVFNAQEGDTVCLPLLEAGGGTNYINQNLGDSTFCFIIDSIRMVQYDTAMLKTFYTKSFPKTNQIELNWGTAQLGAYAERIGAVYSGLLPLCVVDCASLASDNYQSAGALRCYSDEQYSIKLVNNDCDNGGISTSVRNLEASAAFKVTPMPASDYINIEGGTLAIIRVEIFNANGQRVMSINSPYKTISVRALADGIYFLKATLRDSRGVIQKIIIQH